MEKGHLQHEFFINYFQINRDIVFYFVIQKKSR